MSAPAPDRVMTQPRRISESQAAQGELLDLVSPLDRGLHIEPLRDRRGIADEFQRPARQRLQGCLLRLPEKDRQPQASVMPSAINIEIRSFACSDDDLWPLPPPRRLSGVVLLGGCSVIVKVTSAARRSECARIAAYGSSLACRRYKAGTAVNSVAPSVWRPHTAGCKGRPRRYSDNYQGHPRRRVIRAIRLSLDLLPPLQPEATARRKG